MIRLVIELIVKYAIPPLLTFFKLLRALKFAKIPTEKTSPLLKIILLTFSGAYFLISSIVLEFYLVHYMERLHKSQDS